MTDEERATEDLAERLILILEEAMAGGATREEALAALDDAEAELDRKPS